MNAVEIATALCKAGISEQETFAVISALTLFEGELQNHSEALARRFGQATCDQFPLSYA